MAAATGAATTVELDGVSLELFTGGSGPPLLVLHDYEYLNAWQPFLAALAADYRVLVPSHPGFGRSSLPPTFDAIDDLAYFYLDLLRAQADPPVRVLGLGFGGWIAAEMATRCTHHIARLVLVDAVGIKVSDPTTRDIVDHFVIGPEEYLRLSWHDPALGTARHKLAGLGELTDEELVTLLRNRQSTALYGWKPFLHNPKLRSWLRRIDVPTLVLWGESDRIVTPAYGRVWADAIPGARFVTLPAAGHYPYLEQPEAFVAAVAAFLAAGAPTAPSAAH
ncbi:MAG TPA: alpha/beta hydrolase [Chloroflexota bacterium]|jgi:pimeloyl-ACP methyl ester carboxylesterase|nr:alpha/beta hydrolase [Chloroflexota bacterium]